MRACAFVCARVWSPLIQASLWMFYFEVSRKTCKSRFYSAQAVNDCEVRGKSVSNLCIALSFQYMSDLALHFFLSHTTSAVGPCWWFYLHVYSSERFCLVSSLNIHKISSWISNWPHLLLPPAGRWVGVCRNPSGHYEACGSKKVGIRLCCCVL